MTKQTHTIFEHQTLTQADFSCVSDFRWLLDKVEAKQLPCFALKVEAGQVALLVRYYLAVIRLPSGCLLEILPKISQTDTATAIQSKPINSNINKTRQWLTNMLRAIYGIKRQPLPILANTKSKLSTEYQPWETWLQPLLQQWFEVLQSLQLPKSYQQQQYNHPQAQGKLLIKQQLQHNHHRPHYRYTSQQQLQFNPLWGQFFNTVLVKLTTLNIAIPPQTKQSVLDLLQLSKQTQAYSTTSPSSDILASNQWLTSYRQLQQSLLTGRHQQQSVYHQQLSLALELAWIILQMQDMSLDTALPIVGKNLLPAVMINMQQAFEKWVTLSLQQHYRNNKGQSDSVQYQLMTQTQSQWLTNLNQPSEQRYLQPDIVITKSVIKEQTNKPLAKLNLPRPLFTKEGGSPPFSKGDLGRFTETNTHIVSEMKKFDTVPQIQFVHYIVADVKYKQINSFSDINSSDLYQLYAYQQHWQAHQAWLIFPKSDYLQQAQVLQIKDNQAQIIIVPFDVMTGRLILPHSSKINLQYHADKAGHP